MNKNKGVRLGMFKIKVKEILYKDLKSTKITGRLLIIWQKSLILLSIYHDPRKQFCFKNVDPADIAKEPIFGLLVSFFVETKPYSAIYR